MTSQELLRQANEIRDTIYRRKGRTGVHPTNITKVALSRRGNFTQVLLNNTFIGVAKRNPNDKDNPQTGALIALYRAVKAVFQV